MSMSGKTLRVVTVGDGACGKTCLLMAFAERTYQERYIPTVFERRTKSLSSRQGPVTLDLIDTAGQEEFARLRPMFYQDADVILIAFSIDSKVTLENALDVWWPEATHYCPSGTPMVLVGLKSDLRGVSPNVVSQSDATGTAGRMGGVPYVECSAKEQIGIDEVFQAAVTACAPPESQPSCCVIL
ncbi:small GTPase superfamily [Limtongia smithiae]|uniref:small GTPase superfamily n=1 Tax=Limtongia smithiae TaxID=1125753 RepID=UPI0034D011DD